MSKQHTPGPWKYYVQRTCDGYETHTIDSEAKLNPYEGNRVCSCGGMKEEDGHLIAAAPDLLKALDEVLDFWFAADGAVSPEELEPYIKIIAKAKGEQD